MSSANKLQEAAAVDRQAKASLLKSNPKLDNAIESSRQHGLPAITVGSLQGQYLSIQCQLIKAKSVLEIGTLGGYSTIWFAETGASVTSIEANPKHRDVAMENCKGLDVNIILGSALDVLPKLAIEGRKFDFIFIDADWAEQWEYFDWAVKLTRPNGCIYVDNVVRALMELDPEATLLHKVGKNPRVTATMISTVGSHKNVAEMVDGFILAVVKEGQ